MKTKSLVVLRLAGQSVPKKIEKSRFIIQSMTGNANFPTPVPALAAVTAKISALENAYIAAQGGGKDETAAMHAIEADLEILLKTLGAYVESVANGNPHNAEAIILSSGMEVKNPSTRVAKEFEVALTGVSGEVRISTRYIRNATFIFQMCSDPSVESNWATISHTTRARFIKQGLNVGIRYYFRAAVVDKNGQGPWSIVKSTFVI